MIAWEPEDRDEKLYGAYYLPPLRVRPQHSPARIFCAWLVGMAGGFVFDIAVGLLK